MTLSILLVLLTIALFLMGLAQFWNAAADNSRLERAVIPHSAEQRILTNWNRIDRIVMSSRWGPQIQNAALLSGFPLTPGRFFMVGIGVCIVIGLILGKLLSWLLFPVGCYLGYLVIKTYIERQRNQRREAFIAQMPELARTLSNASSAGLSVRTSIALASEELEDPARSELRIVTEELNLGGSLDTSLTAMEDRLPSREVAILVSSLVVSARSGGALVTALRDIAETLETRKELRREIRTTYAQTVSTAYAVTGMGVLALFMLERIQPGTVDAMLRSPIGQIALAVSAGIYTAGIWLIRRMTRIEV